MDDSAIVSLFLARSERALEETAAKYGPYCRAVAANILPDGRDVDEAVSDAYMAAWGSIPPQEPARLGTYLAKLTRRAAMKRWRAKDAQKRGGGQPEAALEELTRALDRFLGDLPNEQRRVFLRRYWFFDTIDDIAARYGFTPSKVKSMLARTRARLMDRLKKEGYL